MLCIVSPTADPCFNLAAEEFLFKNFSEDIFFLYINNPSVVVGKHQNSIEEINPVFVFENNIPVIRRMSGGGTVYHDRGNLNFSFHKTVEDTAKVSFRDFNQPAVKLLQQLGVPATISDRNDIIVNGFKVSGHAQHIFRNRVLSHGTLLIETDLGKLSTTLKRGKGNYESKAIQSVRSNVANISGFLSKTISTENFRGLFNQYIMQTFPGAEEYCLTNSDSATISEISLKKYSTWEWNFGYSPAYRFKNEIIFSPGASLLCMLSVEKGLITDLKFEGEALTKTEKDFIKEGLINQPHHPGFLSAFFEKEIILPFQSEQLFVLFF
jgi:lipoate---protein ligase